MTDPTDGAAPGRREIDDALFRFVAESTYDWESWHRSDGALVWVNGAVALMTGYDVDECLAMPEYPLPIVDERNHALWREILADAKAGRSGNDREFRVTTRGGDSLWMAVSYQPMADDAGRRLGFRTSVRDITERQSMKEELARQNDLLERRLREQTAKVARLERTRASMEKLAAVGELAAGVAHEINNPLAGIRNAFALIRGGLDPGHPHYDLLDLVDGEIERVAGIIRQMYQLYNRSPPQAADISVEKVVGDVFCLLGPTAERYGVRLEVSSLGDAADGTPAKLPKNELKQVLFNLVRNAVQASERGGEVRVEVGAEASTVEIAVVDRGTGIDAKTLPRIFEPFFSTKGQLKEGMGLGLSVTQNLIAAMGGEMTCATELGEGTTFRVTLPRYAADVGADDTGAADADAAEADAARGGA
ncbi:two-component system sensor histidine kinase NtrB [Alienimonas chondri]|uniref:histidine kinase n=1 Tax=Alienimonas chondri TaxID=2681879 RepID=A0ABX1VGD0_9PLAN|nr:ATP-binding protein [Alienimonas chondri]NNJ26511.1 Adaptive-response sensory-kinase SasA [Alienimonas chondri]